MNIDNGVVNWDVRLRTLKRWRLKGGREMPFYIQTGESGLVFNCTPETLRDLLKTYNTQRFYALLEFVSFLNEEGVQARKVSLPMDEVLGYHVELTYN